MYGAEDVLPANATEQEKANLHPVVEAFMDHEESKSFAREEVRERVIPAYMGLISQLDDHLARLIAFLKEVGEYDNTVIVLTADHGDYLGDHWLGEKELFHEASARIPMIIHDPRAQADGTRGTVDSRLVEAIDLAPTFLELAGGKMPDHILEGRSLLPLIVQGEVEHWREFAISEADYAWRKARFALDLAPDQTRAIMITDGRWKYVHYEHFRPQLFDLEQDPGEQRDLGQDPAYVDQRENMEAALYAWYRNRKMRTTISNETVAGMTGRAHQRGYLFGLW
jgi:arylsulfatase A-like enzyme